MAIDGGEGGYLKSAFPEELRELKRTRSVIERVAVTFERLAIDGVFPYEVERGKPLVPTAGYSASTNAMIVFGLAAISGRSAPDCPLLPRFPTMAFEWSPEAEKVYGRAWEKLREHVHESLRRYAFQRGGTPHSHISWSKSFGWDDPFTLTWLVELARSDLAPAAPDLKGIIEPLARERATAALQCNGRFLTWDPAAELGKEVREELDKKGMLKTWGYTSVDHAFPALRFIQLFRVLERTQRFPAPVVPFVAGLLDNQLSRAELRTGEFDPPEMVFSLEGLLRVNPGAVSRALLDRSFVVMREVQKSDPHWRPVKPFVSTPQGHVLFPLSVETASSLLRCCALAREKLIDTDLFSRNIGLFKVYADWLHRRFKEGETTIDGKPVLFAGWHSEHVHLHEGIHLWETSQVLVFLAQYAEMLDDHIAASSLAAAGLKATEPWKADQDAWHAEYWQEGKREVGEPLLGLLPGSLLRSFELAGKRVVEPRPPPAPPSDGGSEAGNSKRLPAVVAPQRRAAKQNAHYSLLLYGPPGTGKTTFAEELCKALRQPLITVTPSDFIRGGASRVEERAKMIFEALEAQKNAVILFDEIDRMLLSRDSSQYGKQGDMFQFITPSMLTKLRDLRKRERAIFLIATNYAERIDAAAKRRGRIDAQLVVAPPDAKARAVILEKLFLKWSKRGFALPPDVEARVRDIAQRTPLMVYGELKQLVDDSANDMLGDQKVDGSRLLDLVLKRAAEVPPAISIRAYASRVPPASADRIPFEEFLVVIYVLMEAGRTLTREELPLVAEGIRSLSAELGMPVGSQEELRVLFEKILHEDTVARLLASKLDDARVLASQPR